MKKNTQVKLLLQGKVETFEDYEKRLNKTLEALEYDTNATQPFVFPTQLPGGLRERSHLP